MKRDRTRNATRVVRTLEKLARDALVDDHRLDKASAARRLDAELGYYRNLKLEDQGIPDVFHRFCVSLANRRGLFSLIFGGRTGVEQMQAEYGRVLFGFQPRRVVRRYARDADVLLADLLEARGLTDHQRQRQLASPQAGFPLYARGILAGAAYFSRFETNEDLVTFLDKWRSDPDVTQMLPHYLEAQGIPGFGAALAADFLKEIGIKELGKPDTWVYRIMTHVGWVDAGASEFVVQRAFWDAWMRLGDDYPPVIIDKLMFLVGSGRFEMVSPTYACSSTFENFCQLLPPPQGVTQ